MGTTIKKGLDNRHFKAIELMVYTNKSDGEIAADVGINQSTLCLWKKDDAFGDALKAETDKFFKSLATKATRRICELMDSNNPSVALGAAKLAMDKQYATKTEVNGEGLMIKIDYGDDNDDDGGTES